MRYNTPVIFVRSGEKQYDPDSGEWIKGKDIKDKKYANLTHMSAERQRTVFGDVKSDRRVIRLQRAYPYQYDHIEINGERYELEKALDAAVGQSMAVVKYGGN